jgi:hypothetical protein
MTIATAGSVLLKQSFLRNQVAVAVACIASAMTTPATAGIVYFECGKQIIAGAWNKRNHFENSLVLDRNKSWTDETNLRELPRRTVKGNNNESYRGQKCRELTVKEIYGSDQPDADDPDRAVCARKGPDNHAPCR